MRASEEKVMLHQRNARPIFFILLMAATLPLVADAGDQQPSRRLSTAVTEPDWAAVGNEAVGYLQHYIRFDTSNPPGNVIAAGRFLQGLLQDADIDTSWFLSEPGVTANLMARLPATGRPVGKPLLLLHHMDVVPADRSRWRTDPFSGEIARGAVWGRGAMDMKGLGIIHLMTMLELKRQGVPLDRDLLFLAVADEEVGGERGAGWMLSHRPDLLDVEYVFDEGGFGAADVLARGRLVFNVSVVEKKIVWLRLTAEGTAGHGSQPDAANPNDHLVAALQRVLQLAPLGAEPPVVEELRRRVGPLADNKFTHALTHTTTALTTLRAGVGEPPKVNVIPSLATATLDNRLLPGLPAEEFLARVAHAMEDETIALEVEYDSGGTPVTSWDTELFHVIESTLQRHYPDAVVTPSPIPYGTDSNSFRLRGAGAYGLSPVVVSLEVVSSMHGDAEHLPIESFRRGVQIFYEIVRDYAGRH
ncbi:MAG: M20/M25/M40 family metallo-hydrolase [Acidobacteriota bacterium]